jgi:phospholipid-binding lipoprotein MlaA
MRVTPRITCRGCALFVIIARAIARPVINRQGSLMRVRRLPLLLSSLLAAGLAVAGCAAPGAPGAAQTGAAADDFNDPFEDTNRAVFGFNQTVDQNVLVPLAKTYRDVLPSPVRQAVHNFLTNLDGPLIFANDLLQGQVQLAGNTLVRIALNSTIGIAGVFDIAAQAGVPYHSNDLGVTLATWGFVEGPYIIVPVLGPSNPRDLVGKVGESFADPGDYVAWNHHLWVAILARGATSGIDERSRNIDSLAEIERTALDYYATIRSLYRQRRQAQIRHEQSDLPNPSPVQGSDSAPDPSLSYSIAK